MKFKGILINTTVDLLFQETVVLSGQKQLSFFFESNYCFLEIIFNRLL